MTTVISVDVQREYTDFISFRMDRYVEYLVEQTAKGNDVILFYNSFDNTEDDEADFVSFLSEYLYEYFSSLIEYSNDEEYEEMLEGIDDQIYNFFDKVTLAPKTYAYFRTDVTGDKEELSNLIKQMLKDNVFAIEEYSDEQVEQLEEYAKRIYSTGEYFGFEFGVVDVLEQLTDDVILIGGSENECLFEIEIELMARDIAFEKNYKFIY